MNAAFVIFHRELKATLDSTIAYIFAGVFVMLTAGIFMNDFFLISLADMSGYFQFLPYVLIVFVPTLSMRAWAEDRKHNTYELLMTLPVRAWSLVFGKFLASFVVFLMVLIGSLPIVVMLYVLGKPDTGQILSSYLGAALLGGFILAIGLFVSGLTRDQIVAYLLTLLLAAVAFLSGNDKFSSVMDGLWPGKEVGTRIRDVLSAAPHYANFVRGVIDARSFLYFALLSLCFLVMNLLFLQKDRK